MPYQVVEAAEIGEEVAVKSSFALSAGKVNHRQHHQQAGRMIKIALPYRQFAVSLPSPCLSQ